MTGHQTMTIAATGPSFVTTVSKTGFHRVAAWTAGSPTNARETETETGTGTDDHHIVDGTLPETETGIDTPTTALTGLLCRTRRCHQTLPAATIRHPRYLYRPQEKRTYNERVRNEPWLVMPRRKVGKVVKVARSQYR